MLSDSQTCAAKNNPQLSPPALRLLLMNNHTSGLGLKLKQISSLLLLASFAFACSDGSDDGSSDGKGAYVTDEADGVGAPCESDSDCRNNLRCHSDFENYVGHGQCTAACDTTNECEAAYGEVTMCIGAHICVAECLREDDCPPQTRCSTNGWCERGGAGSGNPYCSGTATSCWALVDEFDCRGSYGCNYEGDCGGVAPSCYSQSSSYSCNALEGCYWSSSSSSCSGSSRSCSSFSSDLTCGWQEGCSWSATCSGTPAESCEELSASLCEYTPGCFITR